MHGIKRYLTSPTSVKVDSTQLSKMDQTLFSFMAMFVERLPVHEVSWNFCLHICVDIQTSVNNVLYLRQPSI